MDFVEEVYKLTDRFPAKELYGLTAQLRRAATSIALNIAEGSGADSDIEFRRFLTIVARSSYEVMCGIEIATRLGYCNHLEKEGLLAKSDEISAMLGGLRKKLVPSG